MHAHVLKFIDLHLDAAELFEFLDHSRVDHRIVVRVCRPVDNDSGTLVLGIGICSGHSHTHAKYQYQGQRCRQTES